MPVRDGTLLKILVPPEVAVLVRRAQVEGGDAKRLRVHAGNPAVEGPEIEFARVIDQRPRLDVVEIVDEEYEHVAVGGVERHRLRHVHARDVNSGRPVEFGRHLPTRSVRVVAGDAEDNRTFAVHQKTRKLGSGETRLLIGDNAYQPQAAFVPSPSR